MKRNTIKKKKISKDCWDLDYAFIQWLRERLPVYLKEAGRVVDLDYHKFVYKSKGYTQRELIEILIRDVNIISNDYLWDCRDNGWNTYREIFEIWTMIAPTMWW